jgi:hypothetical protein
VTITVPSNLIEGTASTTQFQFTFTTTNVSSISGVSCGAGTVVSWSYTASTASGVFVCTFTSSFLSDGPTNWTNVSVTATGTNGVSSTYTQKATVQNAPPKASISSPLNGATYYVNSLFTFSATITDPGTSDLPFKCSINWGDGYTTAGTVSTSSKGTTTCSASHAYGLVGTYPITVTVTDKDGGASMSSVSVYVKSMFATSSLSFRTLVTIAPPLMLPRSVKHRVTRRVVVPKRLRRHVRHHRKR